MKYRVLRNYGGGLLLRYRVQYQCRDTTWETLEYTPLLWFAKRVIKKDIKASRQEVVYEEDSNG